MTADWTASAGTRIHQLEANNLYRSVMGMFASGDLEPQQFQAEPQEENSSKHNCHACSLNH